MSKQVSLTHIINSAALTCKVTSAPRNPNMAASKHMTRHFFVEIAGRNGAVLELYFSQGSAHTKAPTLADVLDCLTSDASSVENARNFEEWASELGYDPDSRAAEQTFRICAKQAIELKALLGASLFNDLLFNCERL